MFTSDRCGPKTAVLCAGIVLLAGNAAAEDGIATDRPDFVESSDTVGAGRVQVETSVAQENDRSGGLSDSSLSTPTLFRLGLGSRWELRMETDGLTRETLQSAPGQSANINGMTELSFGAKMHVLDGETEGGVPGMAVLLHVDTPTGSEAFRNPGYRPSIRIVAEWDLSPHYTAGVMAGVRHDNSDVFGRYNAGIVGVVVGRSFTDRFRTFAEFAAPQLAAGRDGGNIMTYNLGAAYLLSERLQLDSAINIGANENTPDYASTIGLSFKL